MWELYHLTLEPHNQHFAVVISEMACFMPSLLWITVFLFVLFHTAGMIGARYGTQPLVERGSLKLFAQAYNYLRLTNKNLLRGKRQSKMEKCISNLKLKLKPKM
jgi:hypothetical protein